MSKKSKKEEEGKSEVAEEVTMQDLVATEAEGAEAEATEAEGAEAVKPKYVIGILEGLADYNEKITDMLSGNQEEAYFANEADVDKAIKDRLQKFLLAFECSIENAQDCQENVLTHVASLNEDDRNIFVAGFKGILRQVINPLVKPAPIVWSFEHLGQTRAEVMESLRAGEIVSGMFSISRVEKIVDVEGVLETRLVFQGELTS